MLEQKNSNEIIRENYKSYIQYITKSRNYPSIIDGCKPAHRRCIEQIYKECPRHFVKSATAIGAIVKAHPHPSSIYGTLIPLTQIDAPFPIFDGQGNFGSRIPYSEASAERYTEIKISDLSSKIFESFNDYVDKVEGDLNNTEPQNLATFLPLCLLNGTYSIPTGMSTVDIPSLNALDLCDYAIDVLKHKDTSYKSEVFIRPNLGAVQIKSSKKDWQNLLNSGVGKISISPKIKPLSDRSLEIVALPETKTIDHVNKILQTELDKDQIDVRDETTDKLSIIIEIRPYKKINIESITKKLKEKLTITKSYRFIYSDNDGNVIFCGVPNNMKNCINYLIKCCNKWVKFNLLDMSNKLRVLEVIEEMKKDGFINELSKYNKTTAIKELMKKYKITEEQSLSVLSKPMSYLTKEHLDDIKSLKQEIKNYKIIEKDVYTFLITKYEEIKEMIRSKFKDSATTFTRQTKKSLI